MLAHVINLFFKYISNGSLLFRAINSFFTSFFLCIYLTSKFINLAKKKNLFQFVRSVIPKSHLNKKNTPTMGGILIIVTIIFSTIIWSNLYNKHIQYVIFTLLGYGIVGLIDDLKKIRQKSYRGLTVYWKYIAQSLVTFMFLIFIFFDKRFFPKSFLFLHCINTALFSKIFYIIFLYFFIIGISNAINLTDGLDGLVSIPIVLSSIELSIIIWISSNKYFSEYFHIPYIDISSELIIFCTAISGSCLGFLWFNTHPAQIFMGDVGSLSIGGSISIIVILLHQEILFFFIGSIFILEILSVLFQVCSFRIFKKRVLLMSPIHHHFEIKGYSEQKIVIRFWIVSLIMCIFSLLIIFRV